ncbi:MAG TPA: DUF1007 family protein [Xanthobacteraceae bacterium]|jgi:ABC-type uncharacterized transport system substrate-binding protein
MSLCSRLWTFAFGFTALVTATAADAHPHVWVTVRSELVFAADGTVSAVRHNWTFDEMFSAFATQGLDKDNDGKFSREELAELAQVNVTSLKEFNYFSVAKSGGKDLAFAEPVDYWLEADKDNVLTLHFTLPIKTRPAKSGLTVEIFDPTYFVDLSFAEEANLTLVGKPETCTAEAKKPQAPDVSSGKLSEQFFNSLTAASQFGSQFANRIILTCK